MATSGSLIQPSASTSTWMLVLGLLLWGGDMRDTVGSFPSWVFIQLLSLLPLFHLCPFCLRLHQLIRLLPPPFFSPSSARIPSLSLNVSPFRLAPPLSSACSVPLSFCTKNRLAGTIILKPDQASADGTNQRDKHSQPESSAFKNGNNSHQTKRERSQPKPREAHLSRCKRPRWACLLVVVCPSLLWNHPSLSFSS